MKNKDVEAVKNGLKHKHQKLKIKTRDCVNSGSTLLNMACTGRPFSCFAKGGYYCFVGDSTSGKTFICNTVFAEACQNKYFDDYDLIYDGTTENGALMDKERFFGKRAAERIQEINSDDIEGFYFNLDDRLKEDKPFIYVLDSMDGLDSEQDRETFDKQKAAYRKGKEGPGSYGDGKAKKNSQLLRKMLKRLRKSGSILIIIAQTRDTLNQFGYGEKKTRAGGRALKFYAHLEIWSSVKKHITTTVNGKPREQGIVSKVQVKKNRVVGRDRTVEIPIYHSFGIDDIGSCIDYLVEEKAFRKVGSNIVAKDFDFKGKRSKLIRHIEKNELERDLRMKVAEVWEAIEEQCSIKRKKRYV
jgi:RecA/RadA recombinase